MMISLYKLQYMKKYIDKLIQNDADMHQRFAQPTTGLHIIHFLVCPIYPYSYPTWFNLHFQVFLIFFSFSHFFLGWLVRSET